jgi:probable F420-dependent oxidoreductase
MVPLFNPGPIDHPRIPIHLAAMNRVMCRVAGEMADGVRPHPVCTPAHIRQVMLPAVAEGARRAGRDPTAIAVAMKPLVATAPDAAALAARVADVRARVAFYASMPAYRAAFAARGPGDLADGLAALSREQRWEQMPGRISDEVLHCYATVGTHDEIAQRLAERYGGPVDRIEFSIPAGSPAEQERLAALVRDLRRA